MTIKELIGQLRDYDEETEVGFSYNYGDRGRTMVVQKIRSVDEGEVKYSEYHRMMRMVNDDETDQPYFSKSKTEIMLVLS